MQIHQTLLNSRCDQTIGFHPHKSTPGAFAVYRRPAIPVYIESTILRNTSMIKKQLLVALLLLFLIPAVLLGAGFLSGLINPEVAAGHPNYVRNWHLLSSLKTAVILASLAIAVALYFLGSYLVIRSKSQSGHWLFLAALGPLGFAILSVLNDRAPSGSDRYSFVIRKLNWLLR